MLIHHSIENAFVNNISFDAFLFVMLDGKVGGNLEERSDG